MFIACISRAQGKGGWSWDVVDSTARTRGEPPVTDASLTAHHECQPPHHGRETSPTSQVGPNAGYWDLIVLCGTLVFGGFLGLIAFYTLIIYSKDLLNVTKFSMNLH